MAAPARGYNITCYGECQVTLTLMLEPTLEDYPYCDAGGPSTDPYYDGCDEKPVGLPAANPRQVSGRGVGSNFDPPDGTGAAYATLLDCQTAAKTFDCKTGPGAVSLADKCDWAQGFDEDEDPGSMIAYTMQINGACCEPNRKAAALQ
jgi:hypothetical protein